MLEIQNTEVHGIDRAMVASGNPMTVGTIDTDVIGLEFRPIEEKRIVDRSKKLGGAPSGSGHDNFLSGILVTFDVKYPQYWSMEFQRYHFIQIISSQSKMHKLTAMGKDSNFRNMFNDYVDPIIIRLIQEYIDSYNRLELGRNQYIYGTEEEWKEAKYEMFMRIISNLPMGFEMWMTCTTNYLQLKTIYNQRKHHKLKEDWGAFCRWCETLPMFIELTGGNT